MKFSIHGPYRIRRGRNGLIDSSAGAIQEFWERVERRHPGLAGACGCYLFAVRAGRGIKPWYVGQTSKMSFARECLGNHQLNLYNNVIARKKGTAVIYLIAKLTRSGKFRRPSRNRVGSIYVLETLLIGAGLEKNPKLQNVHKTKYLRGLVVPGFLNSPRRHPTKAESSFALALLRD